jgi:hypothetical protein
VFRGVPVRTLLFRQKIGKLVEIVIHIYKYRHSALSREVWNKEASDTGLDFLRVFIYFCCVTVSMIWVPREQRAEDFVVLGEKYFCVVEDGERGFRDRHGIVEKMGVPCAWG